MSRFKTFLKNFRPKFAEYSSEKMWELMQVIPHVMAYIIFTVGIATAILFIWQYFILWLIPTFPAMDFTRAFIAAQAVYIFALIRWWVNS